MRNDNGWTSDAGSVLVETLVSAVVIAVVVLGVFASLDASSRSSGREKARSVAMSLAEQDQERLRGMRVSELATLTGGATSAPVLVSGVTYTVESEAQWLRDAGGTPSCTNDAKQADYLKVRSTVTSEVVGDKTPPVTLRSTVNPPVTFGKDLGTLAVKVVNRSGVGVPNLSVTAGSLTETTNAAGCALFSYIRQGAYDVTLNQPGWVNFAGETVAVTRGVQVNAGKVNVVSMSYDRAGSVDVGVNTIVRVRTSSGDDDCDEGGCYRDTMVADRGNAIVAGHPSLPAQRLFTEVNANGSFRARNLFPFTSAYSFYSGRCTTQNPALAITDYFATNPGRVQVEPGGTYAVSVIEPSLNIAIKRSGTPMPRASYANPNVVVTHSVSGCTDRIAFKGSLTETSEIHPNATSEVAKRGKLKLPGIPFGTWKVCVDDGVGRRVEYTLANKALTGTPTNSNGTPIDTSGVVRDFNVTDAAPSLAGLCA